MKRNMLIGTVMLFLGYLMLATQANAQQNCGPKDTVYEKLFTKYEENRLMTANTDKDGWVFEVWYSADTDTWTALVVSAAGQACMIASGTGVNFNNAYEPDGDPA